MNFHSPTPISIFSFKASCWNSPMAIFLSCFVDLGVQERIKSRGGFVVLFFAGGILFLSVETRLDVVSRSSGL